jgi:hypothetical protein
MCLDPLIFYLYLTEFADSTIGAHQAMSSLPATNNHAYKTLLVKEVVSSF